MDASARRFLTSARRFSTAAPQRHSLEPRIEDKELQLPPVTLPQLHLPKVLSKNQTPASQHDDDDEGYNQDHGLESIEEERKKASKHVSTTDAHEFSPRFMLLSGGAAEQKGSAEQNGPTNQDPPPSPPPTRLTRPIDHTESKVKSERKTAVSAVKEAQMLANSSAEGPIAAGEPLRQIDLARGPENGNDKVWSLCGSVPRFGRACGQIQACSSASCADGYLSISASPSAGEL